MTVEMSALSPFSTETSGAANTSITACRIAAENWSSATQSTGMRPNPSMLFSAFFNTTLTGFAFCSLSVTSLTDFAVS